MESNNKTIMEEESDDEITPVINFKLGERSKDICSNGTGFNGGKCHIVDKNVSDNSRGNYNDRGIKFNLNGDYKEEHMNFIDSMITEGPSSLNGYTSQNETEYYSAKDFSIASDSTVENQDFDRNYPVGNCDIQIFEINEVKNPKKNYLSDNESICDKNHNDIVKSELTTRLNDDVLSRNNTLKKSDEMKPGTSYEESKKNSENNVGLQKESDEVKQISDKISHKDEKSFKDNGLSQINKVITQLDDKESGRSELNKPNIVEMRRKSDTILDNNDDSSKNNNLSEMNAEKSDVKMQKDDSSSHKSDLELQKGDESESAFINNTMTIKRDKSLTSDKRKSLDSDIGAMIKSDRLSDKSDKESPNAKRKSQENLMSGITSNDIDVKDTHELQTSVKLQQNLQPQQCDNEFNESIEGSSTSDNDMKSREFQYNASKMNNAQHHSNNDKNNYNYDLNFINGTFNWFKDIRSEQNDYEPYGNNFGDEKDLVQKRNDSDFADFSNNIISSNDPEDQFKVTENLRNSFKDSDKKDNEIATRNILNAFLNQNFDESCQEMDYINEDNHLQTVASITTSVIDAPSFEKIFHTMSERSNPKIVQDSIEYDSLNSGSYVSNGSTESLDKLGLERRSTVRSSVNNSRIQLPVTNDIQTCGKCCDDIKNNVIYSNNIDLLIKNDDLYKNGNKNELSCSKNDKMSKDLFYVHNERVGKSSESDSRTSDFRTPRGSEQLDEKPSLTEISVEKRSSLFKKMSTLPLGPPGGSGEDSNDSCLINDEPSKFVWKRLLAQILAVSAKNTLALNFGMSVGFQTIAIPSLSKPNDDLYLDQQQTSLYGSLFFTVIPVGCLLSGPTINGWGRKPAMLVFCLPLFIGWWVYYFAMSPAILYLAILIMGLVNGLLEAPILTYVAEISEARWRGMLASSSVVAALFGVFLEMLLGNIFTWRVTAIINSVFPVISFIAICFVPESPHWLASKGRTKDVEKSLMWLRGWVDKSEVASEVDSLMTAHSQPKVSSNPLAWKAYASRTFVEPFLIIICSFAIGHFSGMATVQTYSVSIFDALGVQGWSWTAAMGASQVLGATACVIALPLLGKRPIAVVSMVGVGIGMIGAATASGALAASSLLLANFCTNACSRVVPWVLIGEVFTNEMRAVASGLSSCICYVMAFVLSYTYLQVEAALSLRVLLGIYAGVGILGALAYYVFLPETEGKSLAEVQQHFDRKQYKGMDNPAFDKEKS